MEAYRLLDEAIPWLARNVEAELHKFDPSTGRFLEGGMWGLNNQHIMLPMAVLLLKEHPGNKFYRDEAFAEIACRACDALRDFQYPDGKWEFVKVDGSRWGPFYLPWGFYYWLETYRKLKPILSDKRRTYWEDGLQLAYAGMREELDRLTEVHNIPTWQAMGLHRAAQLFGRPEWKESADRIIAMTVNGQEPEGYWLEHHGPTPFYNLIYTNALGLYYYHGGAVDVLPALERAAGFHNLFTYPDGTTVETIDGRFKYLRTPNPEGLLPFLPVPGGRRYVHYVVKQAIAQNAGWINACFAETLYYWDADVARPDAPALVERERIEARAARALIVKEDGWFVCLSGFVSPVVESRWGLDRGSFIGVWHERTRLLVGGGNSKGQKEWCTFELTTAAGECRLIPDAGVVHDDRRAVTLAYDSRKFDIALEKRSAGELRLEAAVSLSEGDAAVWRLPLRLRLNGGALESSVASAQPVTAADIRLEAADAGEHWLRQDDWELRFAGPFRLEWPSYPFNPYAADGAADISFAIAVLTLPFAAAASRTVTIAITAAP
ncbi:hypothetical protein [Paenibacillus cymbidii]|uniref:hypothetical protein n=1 Tax=Paenibacillus cymbidii TaxID=1639034 RepID=UPI001081F9C0|nr:hypothetical protein [Paenibacillus cymbidii]